MSARPVAHLPSRPISPLRVLARRLAIAVGLILFVALVAYVGRDGYRDVDDSGVSFLDALYYASVSVTTTGYGDVTPVSDGARLATTLLVTPARILFLILLVGTTIEVLAEGTRQTIRQRAWRRTLRDHTIVCGFGTKGRSAIETILARGTPRDRVVVVEQSRDALEDATRQGLATVHGSSSRAAVLLEAGIGEAAAVVVAVSSDEAAVLTTLTAREHNRDATIVASVRELENRHLLHESGADSVIVSAGTAGRMLGFGTSSPAIVEVLEDLVSVGSGMDIVEEEVSAENDGRSLSDMTLAEPIIGVVRSGGLLRFDHPEAATVRTGDRLVLLRSHPAPHPG